MTRRQKTSSPEAVKRAQEVVEYLESPGNAGIAEPAPDITTEQKKIYARDYSYGWGADKILHVIISSRGALAIGRESADCEGKPPVLDKDHIERAAELYFSRSLAQAPPRAISICLGVAACRPFPFAW